MFHVKHYKNVRVKFTRAIRKNATLWLSAASNASVRRIAHLLRLQDAMLISWRSLRTFTQTDFHVNMKSARMNVRVKFTRTIRKNATSWLPAACAARFCSYRGAPFVHSYRQIFM